MKTTRRCGGFTLIELLVVVAVISLLAAIAIPSFTHSRARSYDALVMADARNAASAEEAYFGDNTRYFSGNCNQLPGISLSPRVRCRAQGTTQSFSIRTRHPDATKRCVWDSAGRPNLTCS